MESSDPAPNASDRMRLRPLPTFVFASALLSTVASQAHADPKQECISAHEESQFLRRQGKLTAEREKLLVCSQDSCPEILRVACVQWLDRNLADLPTIVLEAHDEDGKPTNDVKVEIDGRPARSSLDGRAQNIDPGEHRFRFTSAKGAVREVNVVVGQGQKNKAVVVEFGEAKRPGSGVDLAELDALAARRSRRTVGFIVGGIGFAALATGIVFGFAALEASDDARCTSPCPRLEPNGSPGTKLTDASESYDRAQTFGWVSNIGIAAGVVGLGLGTYLVLTGGSPKGARSTGWLAPSPLPGGAGLSVGGAL